MGLSLTRGAHIRYGLCRTSRKSNTVLLTAVPSPLHHHPESRCHNIAANLHTELGDVLRTDVVNTNHVDEVWTLAMQGCLHLIHKPQQRVWSLP